MAHLVEKNDRRVIPGWRTLGNSSVFGELASFRDKRHAIFVAGDIEAYVVDWETTPSVVHASELLGAAIANGRTTDERVLDAARFILSVAQNANLTQVRTATQILEQVDPPPMKGRDRATAVKHLELVDHQVIYDKIAAVRQRSRQHPRNAILYVELSRLYTVVGRESRAVNAMRTALHLAPDNRFVLRSAVRMCEHFATRDNGYLHHALAVLRKAESCMFDPWVAATEIAVATVLNRSPHNLRVARRLLQDDAIPPFHKAELASAMATLELLDGKTRHSRALFELSLRDPNQNALAQAKWASQLDSRIRCDLSRFHVERNFEAVALDHYFNERDEQALACIPDWLHDMPFSRKPVVLGAHIAALLLHRHEDAVTLLRTGLVSHPTDPTITNNLAYSLCLTGHSHEALVLLDRVDSHNVTDVQRACLLATRGLAHFRSGDLEIGRRCYVQALDLTRSLGNKQLVWSAVLNFTREEIIARTPSAHQLVPQVDHIPREDQSREVKLLMSDVRKEYARWMTTDNRGN